MSALAAYRHLLRAIRIAFQGVYSFSNSPRTSPPQRPQLTSMRPSLTGDTILLSTARAESRLQFANSRSLPPDSPETTHRIQHAQDVAKVLRENVIQGQKVQGSREGEEMYKLRIHELIERGDNDTIKNPTTGIVNRRVKCSSKK
ncbi:hypothetical protein BDZ91DRAFT_845903 [Kalaharituber pfeilii]|nr:hypothetical protein BDZ91DRAFT_845903 [Kalaharituber pfeilii]